MVRPSALGRPGSHVADPNLWRAARSVQTGGMTDTLRIDRVTGETTVDPVTLIETPVVEVIYEGEGRFQPTMTLTERRLQIGGETRTPTRYVAAVPWNTPPFREGDIVTVVASEDPELAGRGSVVRNVTYDTFQSRRVLFCEDDPEHLTEEG